MQFKIFQHRIRRFVVAIGLAALLAVACVGSAAAEAGNPTCGVTDSATKNFAILWWGYGAIENCTAYRDLLNKGAVLGPWEKVDTTQVWDRWLGLTNTHSPETHFQCQANTADKTSGYIVAYGDGQDWPAAWCSQSLSSALSSAGAVLPV
jgi:hypothetical protein